MVKKTTLFRGVLVRCMSGLASVEFGPEGQGFRCLFVRNQIYEPALRVLTFRTSSVIGRGMKRWYYLEDGQEKGPVHESEVMALIAAGQITLDTPVRPARGSDWRPYGEYAVSGIVEPRHRWVLVLFTVLIVGFLVLFFLRPKPGFGGVCNHVATLICQEESDPKSCAPRIQDVLRSTDCPMQLRSMRATRRCLKDATTEAQLAACGSQVEEYIRAVKVSYRRGHIDMQQY